MSLFSQIILGNELAIGWFIFLLAEVILVCLVRPIWYFILSFLFYIGLTMMNI